MKPNSLVHWDLIFDLLVAFHSVHFVVSQRVVKISYWSECDDQIFADIAFFISQTCEHRTLVSFARFWCPKAHWYLKNLSCNNLFAVQLYIFPFFQWTLQSELWMTAAQKLRMEAFGTEATSMKSLMELPHGHPLVDLRLLSILCGRFSNWNVPEKLPKLLYSAQSRSLVRD